jgi:uncharacterized metal-binding protein YceD (DUF177 family)
MTQREPLTERPWSAPLALRDVPETGRHLEIVADERARAAVAKLAGLRALPRLLAVFDVTLRGRDGLHVIGRISATVGQTCVVTLEPIENEIDEEMDVTFAPATKVPLDEDRGAEAMIAANDGPESLVRGVVDLGALATEFLMLGLDPYPRKAGAVFEGPAVDDGAPNPFAALAALKNRQG